METNQQCFKHINLYSVTSQHCLATFFRHTSNMAEEDSHSTVEMLQNKGFLFNVDDKISTLFENGKMSLKKHDSHRTLINRGSDTKLHCTWLLNR